MPSLAPFRFLHHPIGMDRVLRPGHNHTARLIQRPADVAAPRLAGGDAPVPEHRPAARLERRHYRDDPLLVPVGVADEDVRTAHTTITPIPLDDEYGSPATATSSPEEGSGSV